MHPPIQYDIKNHKIFLKKIQYPEIKLDDLYIGNVVTCYNRQLKIVAFGDEFTKKELVGNDNSNKYAANKVELTGCSNPMPTSASEK